MLYKTKVDGGEWSEQKTFFHAGVKNSYPTLFEIAPRDYRAVCDAGRIHFPARKFCMAN